MRKARGESIGPKVIRLTDKRARRACGVVRARQKATWNCSKHAELELILPRTSIPLSQPLRRNLVRRCWTTSL